MKIERNWIVADLRKRDLSTRADWVERTLSDVVDVEQNAALLRTLGIDPAHLPDEAAA